MDKKANADLMSMGPVVMLIVGVAVSVLVLIFVGTLGGQTVNIIEPTLNEIGDGSVTVVNETFTPDNDTAVSLAYSDITVGSLVIRNLTNNIALTNFTVDYSAGTLLLLGGQYNGSTINLNASYTAANRTVRTSIRRGMISGFTALENTGSYLPILVIAVIIAIVLSLVLTMGFGKGKNGMGGGSVL